MNEKLRKKLSAMLVKSLLVVCLIQATETSGEKVPVSEYSATPTVDLTLRVKHWSPVRIAPTMADNAVCKRMREANRTVRHCKLTGTSKPVLIDGHNGYNKTVNNAADANYFYTYGETEQPRISAVIPDNWCASSLSIFSYTDTKFNIYSPRKVTVNFPDTGGSNTAPRTIQIRSDQSKMFASPVIEGIALVTFDLGGCWTGQIEVQVMQGSLTAVHAISEVELHGKYTASPAVPETPSVVLPVALSLAALVLVLGMTAAGIAGGIAVIRWRRKQHLIVRHNRDDANHEYEDPEEHAYTRTLRSLPQKPGQEGRAITNDGHLQGDSDYSTVGLHVHTKVLMISSAAYSPASITPLRMPQPRHLHHSLPTVKHYQEGGGAGDYERQDEGSFTFDYSTPIIIAPDSAEYSPIGPSPTEMTFRVNELLDTASNIEAQSDTSNAENATAGSHTPWHRASDSNEPHNKYSQKGNSPGPVDCLQPPAVRGALKSQTDTLSTNGSCHLQPSATGYAYVLEKSGTSLARASSTVDDQDGKISRSSSYSYI